MSWYLVLACAVLAAEGASVDRVKRSPGRMRDNTCFCEYQDYNPYSKRGGDMDSMAGRLDGFNARMSQIEAEFKEMSDAFHDNEERIHKKVHMMEVLDYRIGNLEGTGCEDGYFQCGGDNKQCVNNILVCDGSPDCQNGHDESKDTCKMLLPAGSIFEGHVTEDSCTKRKPKLFRVIITDVDTESYFPARPHIKATVILTYDDKQVENEVSLHARGSYNYADHSLTLEPPESDKLDFHCIFDNIPGHEDRCAGSIRHQSNQETCAKFILRKID